MSYQIVSRRHARAADHARTSEDGDESRVTVPVLPGPSPSRSAALNSYEFMQGASGTLAVAAAILMGRFPPGFIYVLTRVSAHLANH